jgi:hypothetical protein
MIRSSRLLPGAALLLGLLATAGPNARAAEPDKLIPADADTVISVDLKKLLEADFVKKYIVEDLKKQFDKQEAKQFLTDIGLDPFKDVEKLVVASMETNFKEGSQPNFLIVVRGSFDAQKLFQRAEAETKANPDKYSMVRDSGAVMFKIVQQKPRDSEPERATFATVIDDKTLAFASDKKYIAGAIKANDSGQAATLKKELAALIKKVDARVPVYVASVVSGKLGEMELRDPRGPVKLSFESLRKALPNAETILATVRVGTDVAVDLYMGMKDDATANDMRNAMIDLIDQVKPLVKLGVLAGQAPESLPELLDSIKITSKKKDMILTIAASGNTLGSVFEFQQRRRPNPPKKNKD